MCAICKCIHGINTFHLFFVEKKWNVIVLFTSGINTTEMFVNNRLFDICLRKATCMFCIKTSYQYFLYKDKCPVFLV